jgi:hypothetical protein
VKISKVLQKFLNKASNLKRDGFINNTRLSRTHLTIFCVIFAAIGGYIIYSSFAANVTLTIDGNTKNQTMDGFGTAINSHSWDNGNAKPALDMLVDQNGSSLYRVVMEMQDWESTNDDSNPNNYNWTYYNPIYSGATTFDTAQHGANFGDLWNTIDYLHQKGVPDSQIILSNMGPGPSWNGGNQITTAAQESEWAEEVVSAAYYGYSHGHTFGLFSPNNEEDFTTSNEGIGMSAAVYAAAMNMVATRLDALGMSSVRLLGPEAGNVDSVSSYASAMKAYPNLMAKIDHMDAHNYGGYLSSAVSSSTSAGKDFWLSEYTDFNQTFSLLDGGSSGLMVWEGFDSIYNHAIVNGKGTAPGNDDDFGGAPIAYNATTKTYTPRLSFYQFSQLFKFVSPGSVKIGSSSNSASINAEAFTYAPTGKLTIFGQNTSASSQTLSIALNNITNLPATLAYYQTNSTSNMAQGANVAVSGGTATVTVPANTVFTLSGSSVPDTTPPSAPANLTATGSAGTANLSWSAATDNVGVSQYNIYRSTSSGFTPGANNKIGQTTSTSYADNGLSGGNYYYQVTAQDGAGNISSPSAEASAVVTSDTQAPTVSVTAPVSGATVSGPTTISANASDNTSVVGVQFKVDGTNIGAEDTSSPYSITWDSATVANGSHTLTAVARDPAGNSATSAAITITVNNTTGPMLLGDQTVESTADSNSSGEAEAFSYTAVASGTAGTASFYVNSGSAATSLKVGIYSNNNGHPGTLLTSGTLASPKAAAWNLVSLSPGASLSSGTTYWIGFLGTGGSLNYKDQSAGFCSESYATAGQTNLPTTWSSGQSWPSCAASAYVSGTLVSDNVPPTVSVTAPIDGSTVSGNTTITANASDNVGVTKVEWYLDGSLQGSTTSSPYSFTWNTRNASNGSHQITSKSYDAAGNMGTSTAITVTVSNDLTAPTVPTGLSVTSAGMTQTQLSWNASTDDTAVTGYHIWRNGTQVATVTTTSYTDSNLTSGTTYNYSISAFDANGNESAQSATVSATTDSDTTPPTSPTNLAQTGSTASTATVSWSASTDNVGVAGYNYYNGGVLPLGSTTNTNVTFTGLSCGTNYTVGIDAFDAAGNHSSQATATITTAACDTTPPAVNISNPADGSTLSGTIAVSANASDNVGVVGVQFKLDGTNLGSEVTTSPYSTNWNTTAASNGSHTLTAVARDAAGNTTISNTVTATVNNVAATVTLDKQITTHQSSKSTSITSPSLTTSQSNELLVAFITSDGPSSGSQSFSTVTGGGLTWTLRKSVNTQAGTSEIWTAAAPNVITNATVKATRAKGSYVGSITVAAFINANISTIGATGGASAATGAPSASLTPTQTGSILWGVGNDWDNATTRTVGSGQTIVDQYLATGSGDTFWVQRKNTTNTVGQTVTLNDIAPTSDRWNLALIEILPR